MTADWARLRDYDVPEAWVRRVALNLAANGARGGGAGWPRRAGVRPAPGDPAPRVRAGRAGVPAALLQRAGARQGPAS